MRGLPLVLVAEVRLAFQTCSRQHVASRRTRFSTFQPLLKKPLPRRKVEAPIQVVHSQLRAQKEASLTDRAAKENAPAKGQAASSKDLVPVQGEGRALQDGRKVEVPFKVIPRADITPNLTLSPKERLHIEQLTRNLPPRTEPKVYKKKLRIYSVGNGKIYAITFLRFAAIFALCLTTVVVAPAHWLNGSSAITVAGLWLAGFVPFAFIHWALRPMITEVFLRLPQSAQHSPKAAMAYAKSLPADAVLDLRFMRATTLSDYVSVRLDHTKPVRSHIRPVNFEWVGPFVHRGSFLRPNPTHFYVRAESARGKAAWDVTPGIWKQVYERLTGNESSSVARWRR